MTETSAMGEALPPTPETGLTDAQAAERRAQGLGNSAPPTTTRTYWAIVRENVFTFINNVLFVMGALLVIVGRPFDAFVSLMVMGTNIAVGVYQEIRAKQALDEIALLTRPTATVVRDGEPRQVGPEEMVVGDLIEVGAGDQIVVDGELAEGRMEVGERSSRASPTWSPSRGRRGLLGQLPLVRPRPLRGSHGRRGQPRGPHHGRSQDLPPHAHATTAPDTTVIRVTLGVVLYLQLLLIVKNVVDDAPLDQAIVEATVLVGLVPNGLFVSIAIAYALAAVRMSRFGALVQQANAVESLSHVDTLCVDKTGTPRQPAGAGPGPAARGRRGQRPPSGGPHGRERPRHQQDQRGRGRGRAGDVEGSADGGALLVQAEWSAVSLPAGISPDHPPAGTYSMGAPTFLRRYLDIGEAQWRNIEALVAHHASRGMRVLLAAYSPSSELEDEGDASGSRPTRSPTPSSCCGTCCGPRRQKR